MSTAAAAAAAPTPFQTALLAGALAGTTVDLTLFPLDTLKTRLQSPAGFFPSGGFRGTYRGVGSALVGSAPAAAFFFTTYEAAKAHLAGDPLGARLPDAAAHVLAASLGEMAACAVRVPTEVVKQRAQAGHHGGSSAAALRDVLGRHAGRGPGTRLAALGRELYRGWTVTIARELPFTAIQFPLWEAMRAWRARRRSGCGREVSGAESALCGSIAGGVSAAATTPLDVLKTRVMLARESIPLPQLCSRMLREEGWRPFFAGLVPRVTWISIGGAIFLGSYQWAVNIMGRLS